LLGTVFPVNCSFAQFHRGTPYCMFIQYGTLPRA
jgi:hypothetical protein